MRNRSRLISGEWLRCHGAAGLPPTGTGRDKQRCRKTIGDICQFGLLLITALCFFMSGCKATAISTEPEMVVDRMDVLTASAPDRDFELVESIDLQNRCILAQADPGYGATQGMCSAEGRFIIVARYKTDGAKDLVVYDIISKKVKASNPFKKVDAAAPDSGRNVDLDHVNGLAYDRGFIYVPRYGNGYSDIVRLRFDQDNGSITFDSIAYTVSNVYHIPVNIACHNGVFYWTAADLRNGCFEIYRTSDFKTVELAFSSDFGGLVGARAIVKQGMAFDGTYLYFAFSGRLNVPSIASGIDYQRLMRCTERVIVTEVDGTIIRAYDFPRGNYSEIEDVDTITLDRNQFLLISCNKDDDSVASVYAVPLKKNTSPSFWLERSALKGNLRYNHQEFEVYCDNTDCYSNGNYNVLDSNPFASGLKQDPFTNIYAALDYIKEKGCQATLHITGNYGDIECSNLPSGITFLLDDASVKSLSFIQCPNIMLAGQNNAILGHLKAERSIILAAPGIKMHTIDGATGYALELYRSVMIGDVSEMIGYKTAVRCLSGVASIDISESSFGSDMQLTDGSGSVVYINGKRQSQSEITNHSFVTTYLGHENTNTLTRHEKTVMINLLLGNGVIFSDTTGYDYAGKLPNEYCPAMDITVPAIASETSACDGSVGSCALHIAMNGDMYVSGNVETIRTARYIVATATYMTQ